MLDPDLVQRIRSIFLHERPYVSICDAAALLGWSREEMEAAVATSDIEVVKTSAGDVVATREVVAKKTFDWPGMDLQETTC